MDQMILIDLETQDFPVESGIYEVACLVLDHYKIVAELYLAKALKGYSDVRTFGYGFDDISGDNAYIERFHALLATYPYPLVAHYCPFDRKFLLHYRWISEDYPFYCSLQAIKGEMPSLDSYSLANLVREFEIADRIEHKAMSDVMDLYQVLQIVKPRHWFRYR